MTFPQKYERCMVLAGGGFRFSYYLGMYAAAVETGNKPDLLLASCGGAIAAAVIQALPDDRQRKAWAASPALYRYLNSVESTAQAAILPALAGAVRRRFQGGRAAFIPDLFSDYFFDAREALPLPELEGGSEVAIAIVGGKMLFTEQDVGQPRQGRKLFAETIFCNDRTAGLLKDMASPLSEARYGEHAIAPQLLTDVAMPLRDAVRISIADMFYFRCHSHSSGSYTGGVVDLFPIELAHRLAQRTVMEWKAPFDQGTAIPALRAVLGIDGNQRLCDVHGQHADVWIDASDVSQVLKNAGMRKKIDLLRNRVRLTMPASHEAYAAQVEQQWQYGYQRALEAFARPVANDKRHIRKLTRYNRPSP